MNKTPEPYCHTCTHCEALATGPLLCVVSPYGVLPTRVVRLPTGECGPEAKLYEKRIDEYAED